MFCLVLQRFCVGLCIFKFQKAKRAFAVSRSTSFFPQYVCGNVKALLLGRAGEREREPLAGTQGCLTFFRAAEAALTSAWNLPSGVPWDAAWPQEPGCSRSRLKAAIAMHILSGLAAEMRWGGNAREGEDKKGREREPEPEGRCCELFCYSSGNACSFARITSFWL